MTEPKQGVKALAETALARMYQAKGERRQVSKAASSALIAGYHAKPILRRVIADPACVAQDALATNPGRDSLRFANVNLRGWWR